MTARSERVAGLAGVALALAMAVATGAVAWGQESGTTGAPSAEEPPPGGRLGLDEAVARALARHPSIAAARAGVEAAQAGVDDAASAWRPRLALGALARRHEEPVPTTPIHGFGPDLFPEFDETVIEADLTVRYTLYDGGGRAAREERARALAEASGAGAALAEQELIGRTVEAYLRVLGLAEALRAHALRLDALTIERGRVGQLLDAGRAPEVEARRADAAVAAAEAERARLDARLDAAERELARLIGVAAEEARSGRLAPMRLADPDPGVREALAAAALDASPRVARARHRVAAAAAEVGIAGSAGRPSVQASGEYTEYASSGGREAGEWIAGVELRVPIFDGGGVAARVARALAEEAAAEAELRLAEEAALAELDRALADLAEARARAGSLEAAVESFAEVARVEALRLSVGAGVQADLIDAQADLLEARAGLVEARYAEQAARVDLARIAGALDSEWVARTLEVRQTEEEP